MSLLEISIIAGGILLFVVYPILAIRDRQRSSKENAEEIFRRRFPNGRIIGVRRMKYSNIPAWEFDVLDYGRILRVMIDAKSGRILNEKNLPGRGTPSQNLGKEIM